MRPLQVIEEFGCLKTSACKFMFVPLSAQNGSNMKFIENRALFIKICAALSPKYSPKRPIKHPPKHSFKRPPKHPIKRPPKYSPKRPTKHPPKYSPKHPLKRLLNAPLNTDRALNTMF